MKPLTENELADLHDLMDRLSVIAVALCEGDRDPCDHCMDAADRVSFAQDPKGTRRRDRLMVRWSATEGTALPALPPLALVH